VRSSLARRARGMGFDSESRWKLSPGEAGASLAGLTDLVTIAAWSALESALHAFGGVRPREPRTKLVWVVTCARKSLSASDSRSRDRRARMAQRAPDLRLPPSWGAVAQWRVGRQKQPDFLRAPHRPYVHLAACESLVFMCRHDFGMRGPQRVQRGDLASPRRHRQGYRSPSTQPASHAVWSANFTYSCSLLSSNDLQPNNYFLLSRASELEREFEHTRLSIAEVYLF